MTCLRLARLFVACPLALAALPALADQPLVQPVTAWAQSVHDAFARQAREQAAAARHTFSQSGIASWYGREFAGRRTSSGARFDPMQLTCAHRTLPLGTKLLVTVRQTGRSVLVTVNDRGPYAGHDRIIDLSREAASRLGMVEQGLSNVTVEVAAAPVGNGSALDPLGP